MKYSNLVKTNLKSVYLYLTKVGYSFSENTLNLIIYFKHRIYAKKPNTVF